jgi:hypothetical protein
LDKAKLESKIGKGAAAFRLGKADYSVVGLWNYCFILDTNSKKPDTQCSKPSVNFHFDPFETWQLDGDYDFGFSDQVKVDIKKHSANKKWIIIGYLVAFSCTCLQLIAGFFAPSHRKGSMVATLFSFVSTVSLMVAAALATASYTWFAHALQPHFTTIEFSLGRNMFAAIWLGTVFSLAATFFWAVTVCVCSRGRDEKLRKPKKVKGPHKYEAARSVPEHGAHEEHEEHGDEHKYRDIKPLLAAQDGNNRSEAYEPYRSQATV